MTKVRLSSSSRAATPIAPSDSTSSISPSPRNAQTWELAGVGDAAGVQVPVEPGLVDRADRAEAHRHRGELPELRHQPRVRVGRQAVRRLGLLLAEAVELVLGEPALEVGAGVDARGGVALEVDLVAHRRVARGVGVVLAAEEVVEAHLVERRRGRVGGDVAAHADGLVGPRHHDRRVPADVGADAPFDVLVAGEPGLALRRDGVDVVGAAQRRHPDLAFAGALEQLEHEEPRPRADRPRRPRRRTTPATPASRPDRCPAAGWAGRR